MLRGGLRGGQRGISGEKDSANEKTQLDIELRDQLSSEVRWQNHQHTIKPEKMEMVNSYDIDHLVFFSTWGTPRI